MSQKLKTDFALFAAAFIASAIVLWWHKGERPAIGSQVIVEPEAVATSAPAKV